MHAGAKDAVGQFWTELYRSAYADLDATLDGATLRRLVGELGSMFRNRRHLAVTEMPIDDIEGRLVLEVGSGAGGHAALFAAHGAKITAVDLSFDRARATEAKFRLLDGSAAGCAALQGDGEGLPFADATFDIVYSSGVLHHSPDTGAAVGELFRVLKPGGRAVVMLYCKSSVNYWITLWLGYGILRGGLLRGRDRLGAMSEWAGDGPQTVENPITRCYTAGEIRRLFADFADVSLRKSEFNISHLPKIGKLCRRWQARRYGEHPGGLLVYGAPWPVTSPFEIWLGKYVGWAWNIAAVKPNNP
jgi:SAM-dependent methyltransferase